MLSYHSSITNKCIYGGERGNERSLEWSYSYDKRGNERNLAWSYSYDS